MARNPKTKMGRPSRESIDIANELKSSLKELSDIEDDINGSLAKALGLRKEFDFATEKILNKNKTGLKVNENLGKAYVNEIKLRSKMVKFTDEQLQGVR